MNFSLSELWLCFWHDLLDFIENIDKIRDFRDSDEVVGAAGARIYQKLTLNNVSSLCRACGALWGRLESKTPLKIHLPAQGPFFEDFSVTKKKHCYMDSALSITI